MNYILFENLHKLWFLGDLQKPIWSLVLNSIVFTPEQIEVENRSFITKVFGWMWAGLALTAMVSYYVISSQELLNVLLSHRFLVFALFIGEIAMVGYLAVKIKRMSAIQATMVFLSYAALNGLTMSLLFNMFTTESIASTFLITGTMFGMMSLYGYTTKRDLTGLGSLAFMGLIGIIVASILNIFMQSSALYWITTFIGVAVFVGLTAYDVQKIKNLNIIGNEGTEEDRKEAILGALTLYLDFINLFIMLLRIFGVRK